MDFIPLLLYPIAPAIIAGTDIAHVTVLSLVGSLLLGGIPGVLIGSRVALWLPGKPLKLIPACMLVFVGSRILFGSRCAVPETGPIPTEGNERLGNAKTLFSDLFPAYSLEAIGDASTKRTLGWWKCGFEWHLVAVAAKLVSRKLSHSD